MSNQNGEMFEREELGEKEEQVKSKGAKGALKIQEANRKQILLRAIDVDRLVGSGHVVRGIWDFVCQLDLKDFYEDIQTEQGQAGRPAWDPRVLISLWLLGYSMGIGTARQISGMCQHHPAFQWLTGLETINYHTLADFRTKVKQIHQMFANSLAVLSHEGLIRLKQVAHDGVKIKANAKKSSFCRTDKLQQHQQAAEKLVEELNKIPEQPGSRKKKQAAKRAAAERAGRVKAALESLKKISAQKPVSEKNSVRVSVTDPDARIMRQGDGGFAPSYNVQLTTDAQAGIIVDVQLTQSHNDRNELIPAMERLQNRFNTAPQQILVDTDFVTREVILEMADSKTDLISSVVDRHGIADTQYKRRGVTEDFRSETFSYNEETNTFTCPAAKTLTWDHKEDDPGIIRNFYKAKAADCQICSFKQQCCPNGKARSVTRNEIHQTIVDFNEKMQRPENKETYKKRAQLAEFPNAWIKEKMRLRQFHLRGLAKAGIEAFWAATTFNILQWIRLKWRLKLALP